MKYSCFNICQSKVFITFAMMKRILNYLLSSIAVIIFLTSSSGISFVIHHCSEYQTSEFYLFANDYQCKHEKNESCCNQSNEVSHNSHECKIEKHHKCCSNTKGYLKVNDDFNYSRIQFKFSPPLFLDFNQVSSYILNSFFYTFLYKNNSPPEIINDEIISTHISQFLI
ncbi:MAG: HYC_CC_PP family protein [Bacteroidales bacterium]